MNALQVFGFLLSFVGALSILVGGDDASVGRRIIATQKKTIETKQSIIDIQSRTIELQIQSIDILKQQIPVNPLWDRQGDETPPRDPCPKPEIADGIMVGPACTARLEGSFSEFELTQQKGN